MANTSQTAPSFIFTQANDAEMTKNDLINAVTEYLYGERYDKSTDDKRKSLMDIGLFKRRAFPIHQQFKQQAEFRFKSKFLDFTGKGRDFIKGKLKDYVNEKTEGLIPETPTLLRVDFDLRIATTTLMRGNWSVKFDDEEEDRTFYCFEGDSNKHSSREYRMRSNTEELRTDYYDFGDRFAVYLPFENGNQGILFYVPKNRELFNKMDNEMDFRSWNDVLEKLDQKLVKIIFPFVSPHTERDIQHDWTEQVGIPNIFVKNAINYTSMTTWDYLFASNFIQTNVLKFEKNGMRYASVTFLTLRRDHEAAKNYGDTRVFPRTEPPPIRGTDTSDLTSIMSLTGEGPTSPAYLSRNSDRPIRSAKSKTDIIASRLARTLKDKNINGDGHFQVLTAADYKRCTSRKSFWRFIRERKIKCGSAEIERNCNRLFRKGRRCKEKEERAKDCKRVSEACGEYLGVSKTTATPTSTEPSEEQVTALIDTAFFYAIINRDNGLFYAVGRVSNCS